MPAVAAAAVRISLNASYKLTLDGFVNMSVDGVYYTQLENTAITVGSEPVLIIGTTAAAEIVGFEEATSRLDFPLVNPMFAVRTPSYDVQVANTPEIPDPSADDFDNVLMVGWCKFRLN